MDRHLPWVALIAAAAVLTGLSLWLPDVLGDANTFLNGFVNHELLATLGFIAAITLASSASLHLELNKLEDQTGKPFPRTRASVRKCSYALLVLLGCALILVVLKPLIPADVRWGRSLANSAAILIIFFNLHVLYALTRTVFAIPTVTKIQASTSAQGDLR